LPDVATRRAFSRGAQKLCVTDVGSTTTKAILFKNEGGWQFFREEAATTVERPHEDVTVGVMHAMRALERRTGDTLVRDGKPIVPYLSTSSAGGGLAMVVTGLVRDITAASADRVALGAGAIVLDVLAMNDERTPYRKIEDLERLRPDMVLLAGGFDGDAISGPVFLAELIRESDLHPKLSPDEKLPVIYGGNVNARDEVEKALGGGFLFYPVPNIRPAGGHENLEPARGAIQSLFMDHVMSQAPGYEQLKSWAGASILPTPAAFARILALVSQDLDARVLAIDVGGATTDVFTVHGDQVFRTVSANLGMSYSIRHVGEIVGAGPVIRLLGSEMSEVELWNRIGNKHINPTQLPTTPEAMEVEWAVATEAIREAVRAHLEVMHGAMLSLTRAELDIAGAVRSKIEERDAPLPTLAGYDLVVGSGGILSHSPREAAAMMMADALHLEGTTRLAVDSAFMFPHLGVLAEVQPALARELFYELGIVRLGTVVTPEEGGKPRSPLRLRLSTSGGRTTEHVAEPGELTVIPLDDDATIERGGLGGDDQTGAVRVEGGVCGVMVDLRAHPPDSRAHALAPAGYVPEPYDVQSEPGPRVTRKRLSLRRELAIPGTVFVAPGATTKPDTLVARSERRFLRPFFLPVAQSLDIPPEQLRGHLLKQVGEEVGVEDVIAKKPRHLMTPKLYRSPVRGRIEKILPSGTLLLRETPESAREFTTVNVAKELRVDPRHVKPYLRVEVGQEVHRGQWLAAIIKTGEQQICTSPVPGKVNRIEESYGMVIIEPLLEEVEMRAWLPGTVEEVSERGCVVSAEVTLITGCWGRGGEAFGPLVFDDVAEGKITVTDFCDVQLLAQLRDSQAAGLITGGLDLMDVLEPDGGPSIVVTEGFARHEIAPEVLKALQDHGDRVALIDGTTQLRVGVQRPRIILPA
jgi:uncharacterized protein (TIGR01319 family)